MKILTTLLFIAVTSLQAIMPSSLIHQTEKGINSIAASQIEVFSNELSKALEKMPTVKVDNTKWAFIVAPENYDETDSVVFSKNSGKLFKDVAQKILGVSERRTYALIGDDATTGKVKSRLNKLMQFVRAGDTIYFYYSGHGIPDIKTKEAYLLPKDVDPAYVSDEPQFKLSNIYNRLASTKASKVIALVDSCFSGATDNKTLFKGVAATRLKTKRVEIDKSKMVVLTAGQDKQFSNMYKEKKMRLFSYYLMENLIAGKKDVKKIFTALKTDVENRSFDLGDQYYQSPTLAGKADLSF